MNWSDVGKTVAGVAPLLAAALGGPVGAVAGAAGTVLGSFLGVEADPATVASALKSPDILVRLKELEFKQQSLLIDWQAKQLQAELDNVQGARSREIELAKAGSKAHWGTSIVATIVTVGFFVMMYVVLSGELRDSRMGETAVMLLGNLAAAFMAVVHYYLGSSSGSAAKSNQIAQLDAAKLGGLR